jgi:hypothetical protein
VHIGRFARSIAAALAIGVASVGIVAAPAWADGAYGTVDCAKEPTSPQCLITVGTSDGPGSKGSSGTSSCKDGIGLVVPCFIEGAGWSGGDGCYYQPATGQDLSFAEAVGGPAVAPQRWYVGVCGNPPTSAVTRYRLFGTPPGPQLLADEAVKALRLPLPAIRVSPAPTNQMVFVPTWVWLGPESWGNRSATASVPGMSLTATATPVKLILSTAGQSVTCLGSGTAWTPDRDAAAASPTCGVTYGTPGSFALQATVTWNVSWAGGGVAGTAPAMTTTASMNLRVSEAGGLNGNGGRRA